MNSVYTNDWAGDDLLVCLGLGELLVGAWRRLKPWGQRAQWDQVRIAGCTLLIGNRNMMKICTRVELNSLDFCIVHMRGTDQFFDIVMSFLCFFVGEPIVLWITCFSNPQVHDGHVVTGRFDSHSQVLTPEISQDPVERCNWRIMLCPFSEVTWGFFRKWIAHQRKGGSFKRCEFSCPCPVVIPIFMPFGRLCFWINVSLVSWNMWVFSRLFLDISQNHHCSWIRLYY